MILSSACDHITHNHQITMELLKMYTHSLRFSMDTRDIDISDNTEMVYINRWNKLKYQCENSKNRDIVHQVLEHCKLAVNRDLLCFDCMKDGISGSNKQMRFRNELLYGGISDNDIVLHEILSTNGHMNSWIISYAPLLSSLPLLFKRNVSVVALY